MFVWLETLPVLGLFDALAPELLIDLMEMLDYVLEAKTDCNPSFGMLRYFHAWGMDGKEICVAPSLDVYLNMSRALRKLSSPATGRAGVKHEGRGSDR